MEYSNRRVTSQKNWVVYILECADTTLYVGITNNLEQRVTEHNHSPKGAKYTKGRRPVVVMYSEEFLNRSEASKEECRLKKLTKLQKNAIISEFQLR